MDNLLVVNTDNALQVLQDKILYHIDAYINNLHNPDDIYKTFTFNGLLSYIGYHVFKNHNKQYHGEQNSIIDYSDIDTLNNIWNLYKYISGLYDKTINLQSFSVFTCIHYESIKQWKNDKNDIRYNIVNQWFNECESVLVNRVSQDNSIGSIFLLKSIHGMNENNSLIITDGSTARMTAEQIANKYGSLTMPDTLPIIDD